MEFPALDLRKASVLKKQVDLALLKLKQAVLDGDAEKKSELVQAFQIQIDAIEEFRTANDNDERSILFERERIRLRKGVQDAAAPAHGASNSAKSKGTHSLGKVPARVAVKGAHIHAESAKEVSADTPMVCEYVGVMSRCLELWLYLFYCFIRKLWTTFFMLHNSNIIAHNHHTNNNT